MLRDTWRAVHSTGVQRQNTFCTEKDQIQTSKQQVVHQKGECVLSLEHTSFQHTYTAYNKAQLHGETYMQPARQ